MDVRMEENFVEEQIKEILKGINPEIIDGGDALLDDGVIDSFTVIEIIEELESQLGIRISPDAVVPDHFNSVSAIVGLALAKKGG